MLPRTRLPVLIATLACGSIAAATAPDLDPVVTELERARIRAADQPPPLAAEILRRSSLLVLRRPSLSPGYRVLLEWGLAVVREVGTRPGQPPHHEAVEAHREVLPTLVHDRARFLGPPRLVLPEYLRTVATTAWWSTRRRRRRMLELGLLAARLPGSRQTGDLQEFLGATALAIREGQLEPEVGTLVFENVRRDLERDGIPDRIAIRWRVPAKACGRSTRGVHDTAAARHVLETYARRLELYPDAPPPVAQVLGDALEAAAGEDDEGAATLLRTAFLELGGGLGRP
jgi:hypothetical protein